MADDAVRRHLQACEVFSAVVAQVGDRWSAPTPCPEWDARGIVEHVIGFHDVLLLRPLWQKPHRPRGEPVARWTVTVSAIASALDLTNRGAVVSVPGMANMKLAKLLPMLTTDVLVHSWDLGAALGMEPPLDPEACAESYENAQKNMREMEASGMFGQPVAVQQDIDIVSRLVALLGRDPDWRVPER